MHYSVLLNESLDLLQIKADGVYVDGTFGRGGHSRAILDRLGPKGKLLAFDKDPEAIKFAQEHFQDPRFTIFHASFASMGNSLRQCNITEVDGILLDLGVSSPQLDTPSRGFSFRFDAPLDMRMDNLNGISAETWLNQVSEVEMADIFWRYGEEKFSKKIARAIVAKRKIAPLSTTKHLADLVGEVITFREKGQHPATRVFQAIRIQINQELEDLELVLAQSPSLLARGGRMVVISFHSLEDRIVKTSFAEYVKVDKLPRWVMVTETKESAYKVVAKKVRAQPSETEQNSRSRSAILRCLERVYA